MFAELFERYVSEVHGGAQVFFVSFLKRTTDEGQMVAALRARGLGEKVRQFRFDPARPDLSKLSTLLGLLAVALSEDEDAGGAEAGAEAGPEAEAEGATEAKVEAAADAKAEAEAATEAKADAAAEAKAEPPDADGFLVTLRCAEGSVEVTEAEAAAVEQWLPGGTAAMPEATLRAVIPAFLARTASAEKGVAL